MAFCYTNPDLLNLGTVGREYLVHKDHLIVLYQMEQLCSTIATKCSALQVLVVGRSHNAEKAADAKHHGGTLAPA